MVHCSRSYLQETISELNDAITTSEKKRDIDDDQKQCSTEMKREIEETNEKGLILLPHDVITDILSFLPPKTLGRFRCVCKTWNDRFTHPFFIKLYKSRLERRNSFHFITLPSINEMSDSSEDIVFKCLTFNEALSTFENPINFLCPFKSNRDHLALHGCCDGLLCVQVDWNLLGIWNPVMEEYTILPHLPKNPGIEVPIHRTCGFGCDLEGTQYKVLYITGNQINGSSTVIIFTLGTEEWRELSTMEASCFYGKLRNVVFLGGCLHWIGSKGRYDSESVVLFAFDVSTEKFSDIQPPHLLLGNQDIAQKLSNIALGQLSGQLSLLSKLEDVYQIWAMQSDGGVKSWSPMLSINNIIPRNNIPTEFRFLIPLHIPSDAEMLLAGNQLELLSSSDPSYFFEYEIILYDSSQRTARPLHTFGVKRLDEAHSFVKSIVSVRAICNGLRQE